MNKLTSRVSLIDYLDAREKFVQEEICWLRFEGEYRANICRKRILGQQQKSSPVVIVTTLCPR